MHIKGMSIGYPQLNVDFTVSNGYPVDISFMYMSIYVHKTDIHWTSYVYWVLPVDRNFPNHNELLKMRATHCSSRCIIGCINSMLINEWGIVIRALLAYVKYY